MQRSNIIIIFDSLSSFKDLGVALSPTQLLTHCPPAAGRGETA